MPITTNVVSSNPAYDEAYSIPHYMIKFVSDLRQVDGFLLVLRFPLQYNWPPRYNWNIVESGVKQYIFLYRCVNAASYSSRPMEFMHLWVIGSSLYIDKRQQNNIFVWVNLLTLHHLQRMHTTTVIWKPGMTLYAS